MIPDIKNKKVVYISTAANSILSGFTGAANKKRLKSLGFGVKDVDVSISEFSVVEREVKNSDCIFLAGGNTFFLLQELKRTGADKLLVEEINRGKLFIGESAGAIVAAPDIEYSSYMDDMGAAPFLKEYSGLGITDFYTVPHEGNLRFKKAVKRIISVYSHIMGLKIISDREVILYDGGIARIIDC